MFRFFETRNLIASLALGLLCISILSCDSWFGPADGDAPHVLSISTSITVTGSSCCGGKVRLDGGEVIQFSDDYVFRNVSPGKHTVASKDCHGSCSGGILGGGGSCSCSESWVFCTFDLQGHASIRAGTCSNSN